MSLRQIIADWRTAVIRDEYLGASYFNRASDSSLYYDVYEVNKKRK